MHAQRRSPELRVAQHLRLNIFLVFCLSPGSQQVTTCTSKAESHPTLRSGNRGPMDWSKAYLILLCLFTTNLTLVGNTSIVLGLKKVLSKQLSVESSGKQKALRLSHLSYCWHSNSIPAYASLCWVASIHLVGIT